MTRRAGAGAVLVAFFALVMIASTASAQVSTTFQATANANISQGIYLVNTAGLNFGDIVTSGSAGTVTISAAGGVSWLGGATALSNPLNPPTAAAYSVDVLGAKGTKKFWVQLPADNAVSLSGPGDPMTLSGFSVSIPCGRVGATPPGASGPCVAAPTTFTVGATLSVNANQAPGTYTGTFNITAHRF
jgi:hypothetical protein